MKTAALQRLSWLFACAATASVVSGCGGGGDDPPPPPPPASDQVPASAFVSAEALFSFALDQTSDANTVETSEALKFDLITTDPPTSEDTEPSPLA